MALDPHSSPTPRAIRILRKELYANVSSIPSELGGGDHGHLGMLMPTAEYTLISTGGAPYVMPLRPPVPHYVGAAAIIAALQENYRATMESYVEYRDLSAQKAPLRSGPPHLLE